MEPRRSTFQSNIPGLDDALNALSEDLQTVANSRLGDKDIQSGPGILIKRQRGSVVISAEEQPQAQAGKAAKRTWQPLTLTEQEGGGYIARIVPGVFAYIDPNDADNTISVVIPKYELEEIDKDTDIAIEPGKTLYLYHDVGADGGAIPGSVILAVDDPDKESTHYTPEIGDDPGATGEYWHPLWSLVPGDEPTDPPKVQPIITKDISFTPNLWSGNVGDGEGRILNEYARAENKYKFRALKRDEYTSGEVDSKPTSGIRLSESDESVLIRGSSKNLNLSIFSFSLVQDINDNYSLQEASEPLVTLYWRDGIYEGTEEPADDITPCHDLTEVRVNTLQESLPTREPCVPTPPEDP